MIVIDADDGHHRPGVPDAELAGAQGRLDAAADRLHSGAMWKYAQLVGPAHLGAVTHPGAGERHMLRRHLNRPGSVTFRHLELQAAVASAGSSGRECYRCVG